MTTEKEVKEEINYSRVFNDKSIELLTVRNNKTDWALYHDRLVFCIPENGLKSQWLIEGKRIDLNSQSVGIIHPGRFHRTTYASPFGDFSALFIDKSTVESLSLKKIDFQKLSEKWGYLSKSDGVRSLLENVIEAGRSSEDKLEFQNNLLELILLLSLQNKANQSHLDIIPCNNYKFLQKAKDFIVENSTLPIQLSDIAAHCKVSPFYLLHNFANYFGESPFRFRNRVRVEKARQLLQDSVLSVADVAQECGFADQSHLIRWFKRLYKETPDKYRRSLLLY